MDGLYILILVKSHHVPLYTTPVWMCVTCSVMLSMRYRSGWTIRMIWCSGWLLNSHMENTRSSRRVLVPVRRAFCRTKYEIYWMKWGGKTITRIYCILNTQDLFIILHFFPPKKQISMIRFMAFDSSEASHWMSGFVCAYSAPTCLSRASTYRGNRRREAGATRPEGWMFEPFARYADKQSTTALTNASLASDRLEEMERSIAAKRHTERQVSSKQN